MQFYLDNQIYQNPNQPPHPQKNLKLNKKGLIKKNHQQFMFYCIINKLSFIYFIVYKWGKICLIILIKL